MVFTEVCTGSMCVRFQERLQRIEHSNPKWRLESMTRSGKEQRSEMMSQAAGYTGKTPMFIAFQAWSSNLVLWLQALCDLGD